MGIKEYKDNKKIYPDYIVIVKTGYFYTTYNEDAKILNSLFDYKLVSNSKYCKVSFPVNKFDYVYYRIIGYNINVILINGDFDINKIESMEENNYYKYLDSYNSTDNNRRELLYGINNYLKTLSYNDILQISKKLGIK